jgi:pilus assembly protein Flp/PilA
MSKFKNWATRKVVELQARRMDEEGQGLAEYGLILALVSIACVIALIALGGALSSTLQSVVGHL